MNDTVETINDSDDDVGDDPDWIKTPLQRERRKKVSNHRVISAIDLT